MLDVVINHINAVSTVVLVIVTSYYAFLTKKILEKNDEMTLINLNPSLGVKIVEIVISPLWGEGRRSLTSGLEITNIGNSTATDILLDGEIELSAAKFGETQVIPMRFEPFCINFLPANQTVDDQCLDFGHLAVEAFIQNEVEIHKQNVKRIELRPEWSSIKGGKLRIFLYYRNTMNKFFKTTFESHISLDHMGLEIPEIKGDSEYKVIPIFIPRPKMINQTTTLDEIESEIEHRNEKRDLSGW